MRSSGRRREDRKSNEEEGGGAPEWMTTYGDLMSLLLTFFVLIVSFSSIQLIEFQKALGSLKGALGVLPYHDSPTNPTAVTMPTLTGFDQAEFKKKLQEVEEYIASQNLGDSVVVQLSKNGVGIQMNESVLFDLGKADLKPSSYGVLRKISELIKNWHNSVRVEGHTDNLPIRSAQFPSNWELSAIRAINVIHFLEKDCGISATKMYSIGYGDNRPLLPNDTAEHRSKNRRVEIYLEK